MEGAFGGDELLFGKKGKHPPGLVKGHRRK
jgi:hypothetical protein